MDTMMFYNQNVYNVLINVRLAFCLELIVFHVKEILEPQHPHVCKYFLFII